MSKYNLDKIIMKLVVNILDGIQDKDIYFCNDVMGIKISRVSFELQLYDNYTVINSMFYFIIFIIVIIHNVHVFYVQTEKYLLF